MSVFEITLAEHVRRVQADLKASLPDLDPTIYGTVANALSVSLANRSYDFIIALQQLENQLFPNTATGEFLERWAAYEGLYKLGSEKATGYINATSSATGVLIPVGTEFSNNDNTYITLADNTTSTVQLSIASLTRSGTTVTATTANAHELASNQTLTITGASASEYNGSYTISCLTPTTFSYTISGSPASPALGTIVGTWTGVKTQVESEVSGIDYNIGSGATMTLESSVSGLDTECYTQIYGIVGGADEESDDELRIRVLQSRSNPVTNFNPTAIEKEALTVAGVTRVKVIRVYPSIGHVTILFVRDNDAGSILPDTSEIAEVKSVIDAIAPCELSLDNIHVQAPSASTINFAFSNLSPNTSTMQTAVINSLTAYFEDLDIGESVYLNDVISAINATVDLETGEEIITFDITSPSSDVSIAQTEIAFLGTITF